MDHQTRLKFWLHRDDWRCDERSYRKYLGWLPWLVVEVDCCTATSELMRSGTEELICPNETRLAIDVNGTGVSLNQSYLSVLKEIT